MAKKNSNPAETSIELEVMKEENERLTAENAKLRSVNPSVATTEFEYDGVKYEFVAKGFIEGGRTIKAEEVRQNLEIQKMLVETNSGLIRAIGGASNADDVSDDDED
jgi:hypothetical protein